MNLSKAERDALPAGDFAVPAKRALPIHDERHVRMAWSQVGRTGGLTPAEKTAARERIKARASELGIDTSDWDTVQAMRFEVSSLAAMALDMPQVDDHPNRMPFSGVLTRIDLPSDAAPHGSKGKRVLLTRAAAEKALPSILGMAVDFTADFDGHDVKAKIGIIDSATIEGDAILIGGFVYAADFPKEAARIRTDQDRLGFSYEVQHVHVESLDTDPLAITDCVFTGAAILLKDKAAYTTTSLAASADGDIEMTKEELEAILAAAMKPLNDKIQAMETTQGAMAADIKAGKELHAKVAPFAEKLRACATSMMAAGVGGHQGRGHVAVLNRMADNMEAEAMAGSMPHIFRDHDYMSGMYAAGAEDDKKKTEVEDPALKALKDQLATLTTQLGDLKASAVDRSPAPERKTLPPEITRLLAKGDLNLPEGDAKLGLAAVDKALTTAGLDTRQRLAVKTALSRAGKLDEAA